MQVRASILMLVILVIAMIAAAAAPAHGDAVKDQAKRDVSAGLVAQGAGRYDEAIALYNKAYEAVPHPEILFDLGQAYRLKGEAETALGYYRRYLAVEPNGRVAADAKRWMAELEKIVKEQAPKKAAERAAAEARAAEAARKEAERKAEEARQDEARKQAAEEARQAQARADRRRHLEPSAPPSHRGTYGAIVAGAGGGALIGGLVFGGLARQKLTAAEAICGTNHQCASPGDAVRANELAAQSRMRGNVSTVLTAAGAVGVVTGAILWWTRPAPDAAPRTAVVTPIVLPSAIGVTLEGAF